MDRRAARPGLCGAHGQHDVTGSRSCTVDKPELNIGLRHGFAPVLVGCGVT